MFWKTFIKALFITIFLQIIFILMLLYFYDFISQNAPYVARFMSNILHSFWLLIILCAMPGLIGGYFAANNYNSHPLLISWLTGLIGGIISFFIIMFGGSLLIDSSPSSSEGLLATASVSLINLLSGLFGGIIYKLRLGINKRREK